MTQDKMREALRRRMSEAALLPADDPHRQAVVREISQAGAWAEDEWLSLLEEDERLRVELRRVEPPAGLEERLLAVPGEADQAEAPRRVGRVVGWSLASAAMLMLAALAWWGGVQPQEEAVAAQVAAMVVDHHLRQLPMTVESNDVRAVQTRLAGGVPFEVQIPALNDGFQLIGGRICTLGREPVVYTRWTRPEGMCSLYQFDPMDFGMTGELADGSVKIVPRAGPDGQPWEVRLWTQGGRGYALVSPRTGNTDANGRFAV